MQIIADHIVLTSLLTLGVVVAVMVVIMVTRLSLEVAKLKQLVQANHALLEDHWADNMDQWRDQVRGERGDKGDRGDRGDRGDPGRRGDPGERGPRGH